MKLLNVLAQLAALAKKYGPGALAIEQFLLKGDWAGLLAYLQALIANGTVHAAGPLHHDLKPVVAELEAALAEAK